MSKPITVTWLPSFPLKNFPNSLCLRRRKRLCCWEARPSDRLTLIRSLLVCCLSLSLNLRYREILFDFSTEFKKTSAALQRKRDTTELFKSSR